eukprot:Trichotokara_eunicae@DN6300_c0_g1_i4.p1
MLDWRGSNEGWHETLLSDGDSNGMRISILNGTGKRRVKRRNVFLMVLFAIAALLICRSYIGKRGRDNIHGKQIGTKIQENVLPEIVTFAENLVLEVEDIEARIEPAIVEEEEPVGVPQAEAEAAS